MLDSFLLEFNKSPNVWIFSIIFLLVLFYAALKIKNEPNDYLKKSSLISFNRFRLRIPSWWTLTINKNDLIRFERTDTRYDWFAEFWIKETTLTSDMLLAKLIDSLKVVFDEKDNFEEITIKSSNNQSIKITRKEGMSTIDGIERAYFDLFAEARSLYSRGILEFTHKQYLPLHT